MIPRYLPASLARTLAALLAPAPRQGWWRTLSETPPQHAEIACSATDALIGALRALVGPPGSLLVPAYTCPELLAALAALGERLCPVDVDPETGGFDPEALAQALRAPGKAVLLTHLFGRAADWEAVIAAAERAGVAVIEDAALLVDPGASARGVAARIHSFGRGKPLALGGGGALLAFSPELAARRPLRWPGELPRKGPLALCRGALRDGRLALAIAARRTASGAAPETASGDFEPALPTPGFLRIVSRRLASDEFARRERRLRGALAALLEAWPTIAPRARRRAGWRIPAGALVSALPLSVRARDEARATLARMGIDCPRYWDERCFPAGFLDRFPGARHLARSLLFLPLAALRDRAAAERLGQALASHDPEPFA